MLETVRAFVAERLAARPDAAEVKRRHADYYCELARQAEEPLRRAGWREWAGRLQAEAGNLGVAVRWYLAHDRARLPHMFRALLPLWVVQNDTLDEVCSWVAQLLPDVDTLEPQARAELLWTGAVTAREVGDDVSVVAARERLVPLLPAISDPYLHAVAQLAVGWTFAIAGDLDGARRETAASLDQLRGQDEPLWTTAALVTVGSLETATGRYDAACATWARRATWPSGSATTGSSPAPWSSWAPWPSRGASRPRTPGRAGPRAGPEPGHPQQPQPDPEPGRVRPAGLRRRRRRAGGAAVGGGRGAPAGRAAGLAERQREPGELLSQVREALGADRFDQEFAAGARLSQRAAAAAARG